MSRPPRRRHPRSSESNYRDNYSDRNEENKVEDGRHSKSMILAKSSAFVLFIVLVTLIAALIIAKNKKTSVTTYLPKCENVSSIKVNSEVEQIVVKDSEIFVLTDSKDGKQDLIRIDSKCLKEISRNSFVR